MRFPQRSRPIYKAAVFAVLNAAAVLLLLIPVSGSIYKTLMIILSCLCFISWNVFFYIELYRQTQAEKKTNECLKLNDSYKRSLNDLRARQHDLKNQLAVIHEMLENSPIRNQNEAAFIQNTEERIEDLSMLLKLSNSAVGMLLYNKYKLAYDKGIRFTLKGHIADLPYSTGQLYDLTAILGNIIDNALESSCSVDEISVDIGEIEGFMYFSVVNNGSLPGQDVQKLFSPGFSTKGEGRGFGLSNVRSAVLKHGGNIEITAEGGTVECRVYFPISA